MRFDSRLESVLAQLSFLAFLLLALPASAQLTPLGAQLLEECAATGSCDVNDNFGSSVASGNFNGDGFEDLAVGVPGETVGGNVDSGAVHIFYGSASGLRPAGDQIFDQGTTGIDDTAEPGDHFGFAVAAADFNADGFDDLAISAPDEDVGNIVDAGAVWVLFGSATGLSATGSLAFGQSTISDSESSETNDQFGFSLAAGRIDSGSRADLVIGVPGEDGAIENSSGKIHVLYNSGSTPLASEEDWDQSEVGCGATGDANENGDRFGFAVAVADFDDDGFADVVVGSPFENDCAICGDTPDVGRVHAFTSSSSGLNIAAVDCFGTDNGLISDPAEQNDRFGGAFAAGDFDGDGVADLCTGSDGESFGTASQGGAVQVIFGVADSGFDSGAQFTQNDADPNQAEPFDHFGAALASGNFDGDGFDDLAVGVPDDDVSGNADAGEIAVFYGSATGLEAIVPAAFHSDLPPGMPDSPNPSDFFGAALAAGDFDGSGTDDLAIGVPGEDLGVAGAAGMVTVLYGLDRQSGTFGTVQFTNSTVSVDEDRFAIVVAARTNALIAGTVDHLRVGGSATPGEDFAYTPGTLSWDALDESSEHFLLNPVDDTLDEPTQTVIIDLVDPSAALGLGTPRRVVVSILDNDVAGSLQLEFASYPIAEGAGSRSVSVSRSGGDASGVTILYDTTDGTAVAGEDYTATSGTLTFGFGETRKFFSVPILEDTTDEPAETVELRVFNPQGGGILGARTTAILTISDNDPEGQLFLDGFESADTSRWSATIP
ncbi:MAG: Calx-beta domain-containing protein [Thermoanaerobaculia bacterium]